MRKRRLCSTIYLLIILILFSSCSFSSDTSSQTEFIYNGLPTWWITASGNWIYSRAQMIDIKTDKSYDIVRDPFFNENDQVSSVGPIFADENYLYYSLKSSRAKYQIIRQNHDTLSEEIIYEKVSFLERQDVILGAFKTPWPDISDFFRSDIPNRFAVFENTLFLFQQNAIVAIDLKTKKETTIIEEGNYNGNFGYYQGKMYFVSSSYDIYAYQIQTKKLQKINGYKARSLLVTPAGIYFSAVNDKEQLHRIDFDYQNEKVYKDKTIYAMDFSGDNLYYLIEDGSALYRMNFDGSDNQKVLDLSNAFDLFCVRDHHKIILLCDDASGKFSVKIHTN